MKQNKLLSLFNDSELLGIFLSVATAILMLFGKSFAFFLTDSQAILSDAAESIVHVFAVGLATFSFIYARKPADTEHRYGHDKIAYFSAAGEGLVILLAAATIAFMALNSLATPHPLEKLDAGMAILVVLAFLNFILGRYLIYVGKKNRSLILEANGRHLITDMWTTAAVVLGVLAVYLTGHLWLDGIVALAICGHIAWAGLKLLGEAFSGLMEKCDPETDQLLKEIFSKYAKKEVFISYHQLRHRHVNNRLWIEVHLLFPESMSIKEVHDRMNLVEIAVKETFSSFRVYITTHPEPEDHIGSHPEEHPEMTNSL